MSILAVRPAVLDGYVPTLDITDFAESLTKRAHTELGRNRRLAEKEPDHRHRRLLRARRERPHSGRAAEKRDELPPSHHSITSSARPSSVGGTSRSSALAALRLTTNSYFVGCCAGRVAGFSPLRMRSM